MKSKPSVIAQRLLNLYRQEHVIIGGWATVNPIFVSDATPDVIDVLRDMPTGKMLIEHIENLRSGRTPMDMIDRDLLPYGGMMTQSELTTAITQSELNELIAVLKTFQPQQSDLAKIQQMPIVRRFGDQWQVAIRSALNSDPEMQEKWDTVIQTYQAYRLWDLASEIVNQPISERTRAQLQADMPEYETYLPMFGDAGNDLLAKLRVLITTRAPIDTDNAPDAPQSI